MSLSKPTASFIIKQQFLYKKEAYLDHFFSLMMLQILAILFSFGGTSGMGMGNEFISLNISFYSADIVLIFTMLWGFITGIYLTTKSYRYDDFSFVTNRLTSNISNSLFLLYASILAGFAAMLSSFLQKVLLYFFSSREILMNFDLTDYYMEFGLGIASSILHVFFLAAIGYFIGTLVQLSKAFVVIIPAVIILLLNYFNHFASDIFLFYYGEASFLFFSLKIIATVVLLFLSSILLSDQLEVRK